MKLEDHVERIRLKVEDAVKNALDRCGITVDAWDKDRDADSNIEIGNYKQLIESILPGKDWPYCYDEIVDDYAFTLFNRLICMKVLESHGLYPEMITQRQQHSGKSYAHYMWLETNGQYSSVPFEGLEKYLSWQFDQLSPECDLFAVSIPLHMIPTATFCKEIIDLINAVDEDDQVENDIWKQGNILSQIYEIYNNSKKAALKASGDKVEYDKVHVQSQIYTPEWVVQFLVDNSLGKLYLEMYPNSDIKNQHKIIGDFLEPTREKKQLDEIKIIDPCVGSGNFLLYCFDLLYELYMDQIDNYGADYSKRKVPELIIERNLHGIDLDERAVQLTKVGLFIKAKTRRSSVHISHYNIVSASFRLPEYSDIGTLFDVQYFSKQFSDLLKDVWGDLQQAYKFGSLLRIDEKFEDVKKALKEDIGDAQLSLFTYEKAAEFDLFEKSFDGRLGDAISKFAVDDKKKFFAGAASNAMTYLRILTNRYDVVVSNPPYTDNRAYSDTVLGDFIVQNYKKPLNYAANLYACFIRRNILFSNENGYVALIHPHTFMNIDTYRDVRSTILNETKIDILVDYGLDRVNLFGPGILLDAVWYVLKKCTSAEGESIFINITENQQEKFKKGSFENAIQCVTKHENNERIFRVDQKEFTKIDGSPFIYKISEGFRNKFEEQSIEQAGIKVATGLATADNMRFLRLWWEVFCNYKYVNESEKWIHYAKGGPYCKWYGNRWALVNWENDGYEIKHFCDENGKQRSATRNEIYYDKKGITFTGASSKGTTFRVLEEREIFDVKGSSIFAAGKYSNMEYLMGLLNSRLVFYIADLLNPIVSTQVGDINRVPFYLPDANTETIVTKLAADCVNIKKNIDGMYLLNGASHSPLVITSTVRDAIVSFEANELACWAKIYVNEAIIDKYICSLYQLDDDDLERLSKKMGVCICDYPVMNNALDSFKSYINEACYSDYLSGLKTVEYGDDEITKIKECIKDMLFQNNYEVEDFCKAYSINPISLWYIAKSAGIISNAKGRQLAFEWLSFMIEEIVDKSQDGIVSINDTDMSMLERIEEYADRYSLSSAQVLQFEEFLGKKIRDFIEKDFFVELMNYTNVFMYLPKTPFIWHLSSGENRGFEAFVSIYKWNTDSLYKLKSNYISKRRERLEFRKTQLGDSNTAQILDEKELIDRQLKEIDQFVKKIDELIASGYNPKLDDGVGKNIAPLQEKKMLKADVLNANQLKKYLKAEW